MITQEQINVAANKWRNTQYEPTAQHGFFVGALWAVEQMQEENTRLRAALESIKQAANRDNGSLSELIAEKAKTALEQ